MQTLTTAEKALLLADNIEVEYGLDLLHPDLSFREDISGDLIEGSIQRSMFANIHGTITLTLSRSLQWGIDLVRPWMRLRDKGTGFSARWDLGVYMLTSPERVRGETPETYSVDGYDRLYLLDRQVGRDYSVTVNTTYRKALTDVFAAAGLTGFDIDGAAADHTLPRERLWPLVPVTTNPDQTDTPVTWLRIINDLLLAINFRGVWADEKGRFRCSAYQRPETRPHEFHFDVDDPETILDEERWVSLDQWKTPNRWVFIASNPPEGVIPSESNGYIYVVDNLNEDSLSQAAPPVGRGLVWASVFKYEVASQQMLIALGNRRVAQDRSNPTKYRVTTGPFPPAGHFDVFTYSDEGHRRVQAVEWDMALDDDPRVQWVWEEIV